MTAYKIVHKSRFGHLSSIWIDGVGQVSYDLNKKTIPETGCGPLCAFSSLGYAKLFLEDFPYKKSCLIFESEIEESEENMIYRKGTYFEEKKVLGKLPEGTILCKSITLLKEVR